MSQPRDLCFLSKWKLLRTIDSHKLLQYWRSERYGKMSSSNTLHSTVLQWRILFTQNERKTVVFGHLSSTFGGGCSRSAPCTIFRSHLFKVQVQLGCKTDPEFQPFMETTLNPRSTFLSNTENKILSIITIELRSIKDRTMACP